MTQPHKIVQRPDYVPAIWWKRSRGLWYWANPAKMFAWLVVTPVGLLAVALLNLLVGGTIVGVFFAVAALITAIQAAHYGPRAYRAARSSERAQNEKL
jgi:hypothetical protein